jgi:rhamnosyltransferase
MITKGLVELDWKMIQEKSIISTFPEVLFGPSRPPIKEHVVWAVIVCYNPEIERLENLVEVLAQQTAGVILVDNASDTDITSLLDNSKTSNVFILSLPENFGIATAQNVGIEWAIQHEATHIYLSDQDSLPSSSLIAELLPAFLLGGWTHVAAVGPATVDERTGQVSFFVVERSGVPRQWHPTTRDENVKKTVEVAFLIASGTLLSVEAIKHIGGMRSRYFIDHVDREWCFRARKAGYVLLGVPGARMTHRLGDEVKQVWFFGLRQVTYHSPLRSYYLFRNTLLMLRDVSMPWWWRGVFIWCLIRRAAYFLVFATHRTVRLRRMFVGLIHGFRGLGGRFEPETGRCHVLPVSPLEPR